MRKKPLFQTFIGIDQTGAILPGSHGARTRPLAWAIVHLRDKRLHLQIPDKRLKAFDLQEIEKSAGDTGYTATLVDCVLGLPHEGPPWSLAMRRISRLPPIFGRRPAEVFFSSLLDPARTIPSRLCEEIAQANSVFRSRPFQKNIQTGTFRIWMDMSNDPRKSEWVIWPFAQKTGKFTLFEGYPSLLWRTLAQQKTRAPEKLAEWLTNQAVQFRATDARLFRSDPDLADAVMLAVGGALLQKQGRLLQPFPGFFQSKQYRTRAQVEGWIAGLPREL